MGCEGHGSWLETAKGVEAMKPKWEDASHYSRDDKERVPHTFEVRFADVRVAVTRWIHGEPDRWYLICPEADMSHELLRSRDLKEAKHEALRLIHIVFSRRMRALDKLIVEEA